MFQLYIKAKDIDARPFPDDDLDDIIIDRTLEVNTGFTEMEEYTGILNRVTFQVRFRVTCQSNYYGADCSIFCITQDDNVNRHYTCNKNGSIQCLEGFENPNNSCRDSKLKFELLLSCRFHITSMHMPIMVFVVINPCYSSPCANNGSCVPMGPFDYTCQCAVGYTGLTCEIDIDHCLSIICPNNSMCVDGIDSYECICYPGFMLDEDRCVSQMENQGKSV